MSLDIAVGTLVPTPRQIPTGISVENKQLLHDVRRTWTGPLNTQVYDDKLEEMSSQTRNHLYWLARNKQIQAKARPQTARAPALGERPFSRSSWNNVSMMFSSPVPGTVSRHADDLSSVMSTSSKMLNFCYLCSTLEEHERNHLKTRGTTPTADGALLLERRRQRMAYTAPVPPCVRKRVEEPAVVAQEALYKITVWTGDLPGASTDANVYITIVGDQGVLLKTRLWRRQGTNRFCFVRGSREPFHIKGPRLGSLRTLTIEHDGLEKRHGWYLEKVEVQCMLTKKAWTFLCKNWLSLHHDDPAIKRELPAAVRERAVKEFEVVVETGKKRFAGTDANVYIILLGTEGNTRRHHLNSEQNQRGACFQRGQTDRFKLQVLDVGELRSLRIELDGEGAAPSWYLNKVTVRDVSQPQRVCHFVLNGWLAKDRGDGRLWRDLRAVRQRPNEVITDKSVQYEVMVKTGDMRGAGTTADIYIIFSGTKGKTRRIFLTDSSNNFERSKTESFLLKAANVGSLKSIRIGLDASGPDAGWFCDHIEVRKSLSRQEISEKLAQQKQAWREARQQAATKVSDQEKENADDSNSEARQRAATKVSDQEKENAVDSNNEDKKDEEVAEPTLNTTNTPRSETPRRNASEKKEIENAGGIFGENGRVLRIPVCEEYIFPCSKWFASAQVDGLFERELPVEKQMLCYRERESAALGLV